MKTLMRALRRLTPDHWWPGLSESKELFSIDKDPADMDGEDWFEAFKAKNEAAIENGEDARTSALCPWPGCEGHMLEGPSGGLAVNIKCDTCERKWNFMGPIQRMDRLE